MIVRDPIVRDPIAGNEQSHKVDLYLSFDIEADGTNPMQHSMISFGGALFSDAQGLIDTFSCNMLPQVNENKEAFVSDEATMRDFWDAHPKQLQLARINPKTPQEGMKLLANWLRIFSKHDIKWVARPANFDWMWLKCYYEKYGPKDKPEIGFFCHCLSSLSRAYCLTHNIYDQKKFIVSLSGKFQYTHCALDDALAQGTCYMNLRRLLNNKCHEKIEFDEHGFKIVTRTFRFE